MISDKILGSLGGYSGMDGSLLETQESVTKWAGDKDTVNFLQQTERGFHFCKAKSQSGETHQAGGLTQNRGPTSSRWETAVCRRKNGGYCWVSGDCPDSLQAAAVSSATALPVTMRWARTSMNTCVLRPDFVCATRNIPLDPPRLLSLWTRKRKLALGRVERTEREVTERWPSLHRGRRCKLQGWESF